MDVKAVKNDLAAMLGTLLAIDPVTGLPYTAPPSMVGAKVRADAEAPFSISETDFPVWEIFTGPARYPVPPDQSFNRLARETRDFALRLYVAKSQTATDGEAERKVSPYINAARDLIQKHIAIHDGLTSGMVPGIMRAYLVSDTGTAVLKYGDEPDPYIGVTFTLRVDDYNEVDYVNG